MRTRQGVTIVELLIAMTILGIILSLAYGTLTTGTRSQRLNEASVATQAKLRRVLEVVSQDIRSSVLGSISDNPYVNTATSISFSLITGGAGYQVLQQGSSSTISAGSLAFVASVGTTPNLGGQTLLLDGSGNGKIFNASNISRNAAGDWQLTMPPCGSITHTNNTLLYRIGTIGYRYDQASRTLFFRAGEAAEQPLAYDISEFAIDYLYINQTTGEVITRSTPYRINNVPQKSYEISAAGQRQTIALRQIKLRLSSVQRLLGREVARSYQTTIDVGYSQALNVKEIQPCS